jgi:methyl-accepting chemotaxis protein
MNEQNDAVSRVVRLMQHVRAGVEQIRTSGREQGAANEAVLRGSSAMREVARQVSGATGQQARSAARIGENIEAVRRAVEEINRVLQEQSGACRQASEMLETVSERTGSNEEAARRLEEVHRSCCARPRPFARRCAASGYEGHHAPSPGRE